MPISQPKNYSELGYDNFVERRIKEEIPAEKLDVNPDNYVTYDTYDGLNDLDFDGLPDFAIPGMALGYKVIDDEAAAAGASGTGWISPTNNIESPAVGSLWTNPTNAYSDDGNYASCAPLQYGAVRCLGLYGFDFSSIPDGATITGLELRCDCYRSGTGLSSIYTFGITANQTTVPNNDQCYYANSDWPTVEDTIPLGGNGIMWDQALTKTYLNACCAWIRVYRPAGTVTFYVDWLRLKAYYTT